MALEDELRWLGPDWTVEMHMDPVARVLYSLHPPHFGQRRLSPVFHQYRSTVILGAYGAVGAITVLKPWQ